MARKTNNINNVTVLFSNRKFGVEIECVGKTIKEAWQLLKDNGIKMSSKTAPDDYYYEKSNYTSGWSVKHDGSIEAPYNEKIIDCIYCKGTGMAPCACWDCHSSIYHNHPPKECYHCYGIGKIKRKELKGCEIVSPILSGLVGLTEVEKVCQILKKAGVKANTSCGLHVHVSAEGYKKSEIPKVMKRYNKFEKELDASTKDL
jgi:hypothetical protein